MMFLNIPPSDIKIPRKDMPQIKAADFNDFVASCKVNVRTIYVDASLLKPTQSDINQEKVLQMMDRLKNNDPDFKGTITISADGYVLDGHHRWLAMINCAIRSPFSTTKGSLVKFTKITPISPR